MMLRTSFLALTLTLSSLHAAIIVIGAPGPIDNLFPFGGPISGLGTRYQQAYDASSFSVAGIITSISFVGGLGDFRPGDYTLSLSTISAGIDTLSNSDFNGNLGADNQFFTTVSLSGAAQATLTFNGTPFSYDPALGNLLLDISVANGGPNQIARATYDGHSGTADGLFSRYHNFGAGTLGYGLVTQFETIPEPASVILFGSGLAALLLARWRSR